MTARAPGKTTDGGAERAAATPVGVDQKVVM
jgi:hypothetical protein